MDEHVLSEKWYVSTVPTRKTAAWQCTDLRANWGSNMACSRSIIESLLNIWFGPVSLLTTVLIPAADVRDMQYFPFLLLSRTTRRTNASEDEEHKGAL